MFLSIKIIFLITCSLTFHPVSASIFENFNEKVSRFIYNIRHLPGGIVKFLYEAIEFNNQELEDYDPEDGSEYDFIIVGAGSAGSVLAHRLIEANVTVLLLEAGVKESKFHDIPGLAIYLELSRVNWKTRAEPSDKYCLGIQGNQCRWPQGKVMGGTSVINCMIATRGNKADYDDWSTLGNTGWSFEEVFPYFQKLETNEARSAPNYDPKLRGTTGPVTISEPWASDVARGFIQAGLELGYSQVDVNGAQQIGFSTMQSTTRKGERLSSNRAYLHPIKGCSNLKVSRETMVYQVIIEPESREVKGVRFIKHGKQIKVRAKKEVILSAGALRTPQLLMLSGIGPKDHLLEHGITLIKDVPGVGQNLMDHATYFGHTFLINTTQTAIITDWFLPWNNDVAKYLKERDGPLSTPAMTQAISFLNLNDPNSSRSDMELLYVDTPVLDMDYLYQSKILALKQTIWGKMFAKYFLHHGFQIFPIMMKPKSRGEVRLRSKRIEDDLKLIANYYNHPEDIKIMTQGIKKALELVETQALKKFDAKLIPKPISGCEDKTFGSDPYWECALRTLVYTFRHFSGTAKMGPESDPMAVVNPRLKVYGIKGLRITDASIIPQPISGHINVPTMMIAEKSSDMIKEDWKLKTT